MTNAFDRVADRHTRIACVMAIVAALSAVCAYRASEEERKSSTCDHQFGEAQTYELVQRQRYLDAAIEHERWSDRYQVVTLRSDRLLRHADAIRETWRAGSNGASAGLFDVEAQIEGAVGRAIRPVRDFTDPLLPPGENLERRLRARAQQDVRGLGIANRCAVHDNFKPQAAATPADTADATFDNYLEPLHRHVVSLHRKALDDASAVVGFVIVLVLFSLSEVFEKRTRRMFEVTAMVAIPIAGLYAVTRSDEGLPRYLLTPGLMLAGVFVLAWAVAEFYALRFSEPQNAGHAEPRPGRETSEPTFQPVDLHPEPAIALPVGGVAVSPLGGMPRDATVDDTRGGATSDASLRNLVRAMKRDIAVVLLCLGLVLVAAVYDFFAHETRTRWIFGAALLSLIVFTVAAWRIVNAMWRVRDVCSPTTWTAVAKGPFAYVAFALVAAGVFDLGVPWVALIVERRSYEWFDLTALAGLALLALWVRILDEIERSLRIPPPELGAAAEQPLPFTDLVPPSPAQPTAPHAEEALHEPPEPPTEVAEPSTARLPRLPKVNNWFGGFVVSLIAATVFCSAFLTYLYTKEGGQANEFAAKASGEQLELMRSSSRQGVVAYRTIESLVALREIRLRTVAAKELRASAAANGQREAFAIWDHEARRSQLASEAVANRIAPDPRDAQWKATVSRIFSGENGPEDDPSFPAKLFIGSTIWMAAERLAMWDAYDDANTASEGRADVLLAAATFFAIALYLLGQSLGMGRDNYAGYVLTGTAGLLLLFGIGLAVYGLEQEIPPVERMVTLPEACRTGDEAADLTIADAAATCFARAELLTALARNPGDYDNAQKAYTAATGDELRPGFTLAHYRSIGAMSQFPTLRRTERITVLDRDAVKAIVPREKRVVENLQDRDRAVPVLLRENFGFHEYLRAVDTEDATLLNDAVADLRIAAKNDPQARFHLAVALLAAHRKDEAETYRLAVAAPSQNDDSRIAAINDLELLREICPPGWHQDDPSPTPTSRPGKTVRTLRKRPMCQSDLNMVVNNREAAILRTLWHTKRSFSMRFAHAGLEATAMPGGIAWTLQVSPPAPAGLPLVMVVSRKDETERKNWYVVASLSGPVRSASELTRGEGATLIGFRNVLQRNAACLPSGALYRIELRLGRRVLAGTTSRVPRTLPSFGSVVLHEQGVAMCLPDGDDGWTRFGVHPGHLEASYRTADRVAGAELFAFFAPRDASDQARRAFRRRAVDDALQRLLGRGIAGRGMPVADETCLHGPGMGQSTRVAYTFPRLDVIAQTWSSKDGLVHVALVWRAKKSGLWARAVACRVLASLTSLDDAAPTASGG